MVNVDTTKMCTCGIEKQPCQRHPDANQLKQLCDNALVEKFHISAKEVSFYNAAEGDCWRNESGARSKAKRQFKIICEEMDERGIEKPTKGYLL